MNASESAKPGAVITAAAAIDPTEITAGAIRLARDAFLLSSMYFLLMSFSFD